MQPSPATTAPQQQVGAAAPAPIKSGADMDTSSNAGDAPVSADIKAEVMDSFVLGMMRKPLYAIHPRRANRTVTMWKGAVTVQAEDPMRSVYKTLNDENILSAPVIAANGRFYGFVDMMDIVMFTVRLFPKESDISKETLTTFFTKEEKFSKTTVRELLEEVHPNRDWKEYRQAASVPKDFSLLYGYEAMARRSCKRIVVLDETQQVYSVLTQSMLLGWLYNNLEDALKPIRDLPVRLIGAEKSVVSIKENEPAINAFRLMAEKGVHGLAVVDQKSQIVDAVSLRDLRGITPTAEEFLRLWRPITAFKKEIREKHPTKTPVFPDLYLLPTDTLKTAIVMMDEDRVHRLFVVRSTQDKTPIGVITQTDILRYVLSLCSGSLFADDDEPEDVTISNAPPAAVPLSSGPGATSGPTGAAPEMASAAPPSRAAAAAAEPMKD